jgi:hypothetical protein
MKPDMMMHMWPSLPLPYQTATSNSAVKIWTTYYGGKYNDKAYAMVADINKRRNFCGG